MYSIVIGNALKPARVRHGSCTLVKHGNETDYFVFACRVMTEEAW